MHYTLCDYLIDIVENSVQANSTNIVVTLMEDDKEIRCTITDNGKGMDEKTLHKALDPFYTEEGKHPKRRFGFGLPFLTQAVTASGGEFNIDSKPGEGTSLKFNIDLDNIDAPPLGDITGTILTAISYEGNHNLVFTHGLGGKKYSISRAELSDILGDLTEAGNLSLAKQYIKSQEDDLKETVNQ